MFGVVAPLLLLLTMRTVAMMILLQKCNRFLIGFFPHLCYVRSVLVLFSFGHFFFLPLLFSV